MERNERKNLNRQINNKTLDTLELSRSVLKDKLPNHKLNTLAKYFEIKPPTHSARDDVMTTYEVYKKLISIKWNSEWYKNRYIQPNSFIW